MKAKPAACKQTKPQAMKRTTEIGHNDAKLHAGVKPGTKVSQSLKCYGE